jgi:membrane protein
MTKSVKRIPKRIKTFFKDLITRIIKDDFMGTASEMAYIFTLAIFPFLIFLVSVFGLLGTASRISKIMDFLSEIAPLSAMQTIENVLTSVMQSSTKSLATISLVTSLFLASNATAVAIKGLNKAYKTKETRPYWYVRLLSILLVILNATIMFLGVNLTVFAQIIISSVSQFVTIQSALIDTINTILALRWLVAFAALFIMIFLNYYFMPNTETFRKKVRVVYTLPGTLFFCSFWLMASYGFSLYVNNFGSYDKVYGILGGFAVLLLWLYYTSLIMLIGGEVNYQVYKKFLKKYNLM